MDSSGHIVCHGAISSLSHLFQSTTARFSVLVGVVFALQARACGQWGCVVLPDGRGQWLLHATKEASTRTYFFPFNLS